MPLTFEGGRHNGDEGAETSTKAHILKPLVHNFVMRVLSPLNESKHTFVVDLDIEASEISDDSLYLRNMRVQFKDTDISRNQHLAARVRKMLQDSGCEVFGDLGQAFDLRISRKGFEQAASGAYAVAKETKEQVIVSISSE